MADRAPATSGEVDEVRSAVIDATNLSKSFDDVNVLREVSFSLPEAATTAIVGPNGSGKTTLVELIAGVEAPTSGEVTLNATGDRPVGYLPQDPRFQPSATVHETVTFYASLLADETDVNRALARVGLGDAANRRTGDLSGGMRRLLGIAVSLLGSPSVVVLDEPTSGLDPEMTRHVHDVISELADGGQSVVLTTHDLSRAADANHVLILSGGTIVSAGSPAAVLDETKTESLEAAFEAAVTERAVTPGGGDRE